MKAMNTRQPMLTLPTDPKRAGCHLQQFALGPHLPAPSWRRRIS